MANSYAASTEANGQHTIVSAPLALPLPSSLTAANPQNGPQPLLGDTAGEELLESGTVSGGSATNPIPELKTTLTTGLGGKRKAEEDPKDAQERAQQEYKRRLMAASLHDRTKAFNPDYMTKFTSRNDMYSRLLCFHVFQATAPQLKPEEEWKAECEAKIRDIASKLDKLSAQWEKLITASRPGPTYVPREEKILLDKLSYFDEKFDLEAIKTRLGLKPAAAQPQRQVSGIVINPIPQPSSSQGGLSAQRTTSSTPHLVRTPTPTVLPSALPTTVVPIPLPSAPTLAQNAVVIPPPVVPLPVSIQHSSAPPYSQQPAHSQHQPSS